ncbi:Crp/Fnr family transcriptional regulator [Hymenobacter sp. 15J16-1T3B]|uniref:Crp/Fnr family transcriptional regulator n=1 Tax=Hymenobacter sp. 15J16-1T3B TaxID=2886941 RepID=UPI001D12CEF5|nr:Crp/Fnr family transcriptional regulator [Hymenobacter sp. 15J16-1T3B]MCC3160349.1 Crp/Fnr family transcriptional regulator [Hymenobacter sp. 15J16-1T3B]
MNQDSLRTFLQSTGSISAAQAADIAQTFCPRQLRRHELWLRAGKVSDEYLLLTSGYVRSFAYDTDGHDVTTGFFASGQVVLEVSSFFMRTPSQENFQALTDCSGWALSYAQLNGLFHARPEFREFGRGVLVRGFAALKTRMLEMITTPAAARYEHLLATHPDIVQHAPLKDVASYLGVTDTSLSRLRKAAAGKK